jgi:hypothetical protein
MAEGSPVMNQPNRRCSVKEAIFYENYEDLVFPEFYMKMKNNHILLKTFTVDDQLGS